MEPYWTAAPFKELPSNGSQGRFLFVKTGRTDHGRTSQFENEIGFFQDVFAEKRSPSCILFRIWLIWLESFD